MWRWNLAVSVGINCFGGGGFVDCGDCCGVDDSGGVGDDDGGGGGGVVERYRGCWWSFNNWVNLGIIGFICCGSIGDIVVEIKC